MLFIALSRSGSRSLSIFKVACMRRSLASPLLSTLRDERTYDEDVAMMFKLSHIPTMSAALTAPASEIEVKVEKKKGITRYEL